MSKLTEVRKSKGSYTEAELRSRNIGVFRDEVGENFIMKLSTYESEGVLLEWKLLKRSALALCTDERNFTFRDLAHHVAQIVMDRFLIRRARGEKVTVPRPLVEKPIEAKANGSPAPESKKGILKGIARKSDFTKWTGKIDTLNDINWIYNHLMVEDVKPEDAPSPGAWAHLQYHRSDPAAMTEFFTKVYPRLIPAKGTLQKMQDKLHDDGRTTFDLLDRLLAEDAAGEGEVPVLQLELPERAGLQDEAGQSLIPQADS